MYIITFLCLILSLTAHQGHVMFSGVPVPGATVTAAQGEKKFVAITDRQGAYSFPELAEGTFLIQVEMPGFATIRQELSGPTATFELKMLPPGEMHAEAVRESPAPAAAGASPKRLQAADQPNPAGFRQTEVNVADAGAAAVAAAGGGAVPSSAPSPT